MWMINQRGSAEKCIPPPLASSQYILLGLCQSLHIQNCICARSSPHWVTQTLWRCSGWSNANSAHTPLPPNIRSNHFLHLRLWPTIGGPSIQVDFHDADNAVDFTSSACLALKAVLGSLTQPLWIHGSLHSVHNNRRVYARCLALECCGQSWPWH